MEWNFVDNLVFLINFTTIIIKHLTAGLRLFPNFIFISIYAIKYAMSVITIIIIKYWICDIKIANGHSVAIPYFSYTLRNYHIFIFLCLGREFF